MSSDGSASMIFVTGCARSGTSLTTRILQAHGCNLGPESLVNPLFENTGIRQNLLKPYLVRCGGDEQGQKTLPDTDNLPPLPGLREQVLSYFSGGTPRAYKDAKLTLVWPTFAAAFPTAKWIIVRRHRDSIIDSCLRTPFMMAYDTREGWLYWIEEHERRFEKMRDALSCAEVWPDRFIDDPDCFEPVVAFCGLKFDRAAVAAAIDKSLWHGGKACV